MRFGCQARDGWISERTLLTVADPDFDGRQAMLTMTESAAEAVRQISAGSGLEPDRRLRIAAGQPTPEATPLELSVTGGAESTDQTIEEGGARAYLEALVAPALDDKMLDAEIDDQHVRFPIREALPGSADGNAPGV